MPYFPRKKQKNYAKYSVETGEDSIVDRWSVSWGKTNTYLRTSQVSTTIVHSSSGIIILPYDSVPGVRMILVLR